MKNKHVVINRTYRTRVGKEWRLVKVISQGEHDERKFVAIQTNGKPLLRERSAAQLQPLHDDIPVACPNCDSPTDEKGHCMAIKIHGSCQPLKNVRWYELGTLSEPVDG